MSRVRLFQVLGLVLISSCVKQQTSRPIPSTEPPSRIPTAPTDSNRVFSLLAGVYASGLVQYNYSRISSIRSVFGDSLPRTDSTHTTAVLTAAYSPLLSGRGFRVVVQADSIATIPSTTSAYFTQVDTVVVEERTGHSIISRSDSVCSQSASERLFHGDELAPAIPASASPARSWADSTTRNICRGGIQIAVRRTARYRFSTSTPTSNQNDSTQLIRITEMEMRGIGSQWQQQVEVRGRGTAIDTLTIAHSTHRLVRVSGESRAELEFRSTLRIQRFEQTVRTTITTRP